MNRATSEMMVSVALAACEVVRERVAVGSSVGRAVLGAACIAGSTACAANGAIEGVVVDKATRQPLPDAMVLARWRGSAWAAVQAEGVCYHVESARADAKGRYRIPAWAGNVSPRIIDREVLLEAFKSGYGEGGDFAGGDNTIALPRFQGSDAKYFGTLVGMAQTSVCGEAGDSQRNLYRFVAAILDEIDHRAVTDDQKAELDYLHHFKSSLLVNRSKPTFIDDSGAEKNVNPADEYKPEDLLK